MSSASRLPADLGFFSGAAVLLGGQRVWLFVDVAAGHGSPAGNVLRIACSLLLFAFSILFFVVGIIKWKSRPSEGNTTSEVCRLSRINFPSAI